MCSLEFSRLETAALITVEWKMTNPPEKSLRGFWSNKSAYSRYLSFTFKAWHVWKKFNLWSNLGLVGQQFKLRNMYRALKLQDQILWIDAESLALPSFDLSRVSLNICKLSHYMFGVLTWTVEYSESEHVFSWSMWAQRLPVSDFWFLLGLHLFRI